MAVKVVVYLATEDKEEMERRARAIGLSGSGWIRLIVKRELSRQDSGGKDMVKGETYPALLKETQT